MTEAKCNSCGAAITDNAKFCSECGAPVIPNEEASQKINAEKKPVYEVMPALISNSSDSKQDAGTQQNEKTQEQYNPYITPPPPDSRYATIGLWSYVGMMILFALPLVGFILAIVWAFEESNLNRRNYARAALVITAIKIVISIILIIIFVVLLSGFIKDIYEYYSSGGYYFPFDGYDIKIDRFNNIAKYNSGAFISRYFGDILRF